MRRKSPGVSHLYEAAELARPVARPRWDGLRRRPSKAEREARRAREKKKTLKRAMRYLEDAIAERKLIEQLLESGATVDSEGWPLTLRLANLINRENGLRAAISRLIGDDYIEELFVNPNTRPRRKGLESSIAPEPLKADPEPDLGELGVPLPDERQRFEGLTYVSRDGQNAFREMILSAYSGCALTGCTDEVVLEAAHIIPYVNVKSNIIQNGICLRADLHLLFDRGLLRIDQDYVAIVDDKLQFPEYRQINGRPLRLPANVANWPDKRYLAIRSRFI